MDYSGPVASNHSNLYNKILALVLGRYRVIHSEVNGTGTGMGGSNRNAADQLAWVEQDSGNREM